MTSIVKLLLEVSIDDLHRQFVDSGKLSQSEFEAICRATENKSAYATWLCKKVADKTVSILISGGISNVQFWHDFFEKFDKLKKNLTLKDINQIKSLEDISRTLHEIKKVEEEQEEKRKLKDIDRFKIGAVEANGKGYLVYKLPKGHPENKPISVALGRTQRPNRGWCTAYDGEARYWGDHIDREDLYIFLNPADRLDDKYQLQFGYYDARLFPITTDRAMDRDAIVDKFLPFYEFLHEKENRPYPDYIREAIDQINMLDNQQTTLESLRLLPDIYKVEQGTPTENWAGPLRRLLRANKGEYLNKVMPSLERCLRDHTVYFIEVLGDDSNVYMVGVDNFEHTLNGSGVPIDVKHLINALSFIISNYNAQAYTTAVRDLYNKLKQISEHENIRLGAVAQFLCEPSTLPKLADFHKGKIGKVDFHIVPEGTNIYGILRAIQPDMDLRRLAGYQSNYANHGVTGIITQGKDTVFLENLYDGQNMSIYRPLRFKDGKETSQCEYNPDVLYEMYKGLKSFDEHVVYPRDIQKVSMIKDDGIFDRFKIDNVGKTTELYKIPVDKYTSIPYSLPEVRSYSDNGHVYLGRISKWQFVLSTLGGFVLTGRWGSSGSSSWIESVPGLGETLWEMCQKFNLRVPEGLATYLAKHPDIREKRYVSDNGTEQPQQQQQPEQSRERSETQSEGTLSTGEPVGRKNKPIINRVKAAVEEGISTNGIITVANYRLLNRTERTLRIPANYIKGTWSDFEYSMLQSGVQMVRRAVDYAQIHNYRITDVYAWPSGNSWCGLLVMKDMRGRTVQIYRRVITDSGSGFKRYFNSDDWYLLL